MTELPADHLKKVGIDRWLGQPYFFEPLQEDIAASAMMATIGAIRRNFENSCIRYNYK